LSKLGVETTASLTEWVNGLFPEGKAAEAGQKIVSVAELKNE